MKFPFSDKLATLKIKEENISVTVYYTGGIHLPYRTYVYGKLLFKGTDYRPSNMHGIDSIESLLNLLAFQCVKPSDTDDEYFSEYNGDQMEFAESDRAERISLIISDIESSDDDNDDAEEIRKAARRKIQFRRY